MINHYITSICKNSTIHNLIYWKIFFLSIAKKFKNVRIRKFYKLFEFKLERTL